MRDLLLDILHHPYSGMVERYRRLRTSRRKGNHLKDSIIQQTLAAQVRVATRSGVVVLLDLTAKGRSLLAVETGIGEVPPRHGGIDHEYWKHSIAAELRAQDYSVEVEASLATGGIVDILVRTTKGAKAIEVETGKSDVEANVQKCQKAEMAVAVVATSREVAQQLRQSLPTQILVGSVLKIDLGLDGFLKR